MALTHDDTYDIVTQVGRRYRLRTDDAELLHLHSNAIFALPSHGLAVRIASNPDALESITGAVAVTRWLHERGFPCTVPADLEQPIEINGRVVSLWRLIETMPDPPGTAEELARLLRLLHDTPPPVRLGSLSDPLRSAAVAAKDGREAMTPQDRQWLLWRIGVLRAQWDSLAFPNPPTLIHGDAHPNNLLRALAGGVVLGDWDHVAVGPREWDLVQVHYMHRRFGRLTQADLDRFTAAYGWDVRDWAGTSVLIEVREISGLSPYIRSAPHSDAHRREVALRLTALRTQDISARWTPPADL